MDGHPHTNAKLRIALVSYEFEGTSASGGIGTYLRMLAAMLAERGHDVEVFCHGAGYQRPAGAAAFRVNGVDSLRDDFAEAIVPVFAARHEAKPFDLIEGADYLAESAAIARKFPHIPLVLKLHAPSSFINSTINARYIPLAHKARFFVGETLRGRVPKPYWTYNPAYDVERASIMAASGVTSPSQAMVRELARFWGLAPERVSVIPNVFNPADGLLATNADTRTSGVLFVGRLEVRKGVLDLAAAIPRVCRAYPDVRFSFVGGSQPHPGTKEDLRAVVSRRLGRYASQVTFTGGVPNSEIATHYARNDICVFPSVWENFPNVCLEAMAAARGVVASASGGMAEMVEDGRSGLLVPPRNPAALARAIVTLLRDPSRRAAMGRAARAHVLSAYGSDAIGPLQEDHYRQILTPAPRSAAHVGAPAGR